MNSIKKLILIGTIACSLTRGIFAMSETPEIPSEIETYAFIDPQLVPQNYPECFSQNPQEFIHSEYHYVQDLPQLGYNAEVDWAQYNITKAVDYNSSSATQIIDKLKFELIQEHKKIICLISENKLVTLSSFDNATKSVERLHSILQELPATSNLHANENFANLLATYLATYSSIQQEKEPKKESIGLLINHLKNIIFYSEEEEEEEEAEEGEEVDTQSECFREKNEEENVPDWDKYWDS